MEESRDIDVDAAGCAQHAAAAAIEAQRQRAVGAGRELYGVHHRRVANHAVAEVDHRVGHQRDLDLRHRAGGAGEFGV